MIRYDPNALYNWSLTGILSGRITWPDDNTGPNEFNVIYKWMSDTFGQGSEHNIWMIMAAQSIITYTFYFTTEDDAVMFKIAWMDNVRFI